MLSTPESNVVLTDAQTAAIEESKNILLNLETEITRASRTLNATKNEIISANAEKDYLDTQIVALSQAKDELQKEVDSKNEYLVNINRDLEETQKNNTGILLAQKMKDNELSSREKAVQTLEVSLANDKVALESKQQQIASERIEVESAREAFKTAITAVSWK